MRGREPELLITFVSRQATSSAEVLIVVEKINEKVYSTSWSDLYDEGQLRNKFWHPIQMRT